MCRCMGCPDGEREIQTETIQRQISGAAAESGGFGASEGIRTLDIHLGKVTLYQAELHSHRTPFFYRPHARGGKR